MLERHNIIWISDGPDYPSGFATVGRNLTFRLSNLGHKIYYLHCQKAGFLMDFYGSQFEDISLHYPNTKITILPGSSETSFFGRDMFPIHYKNLEEKVGIDTVVSQMDLHMTSYIVEHHKENPYQWLHYLPIDGDPLPSVWHYALGEIDKIVTMSKYGHDVLEDFGYDSTMIYHGVDTELFKPMKVERPENWQDKFVIGVTNRNQHRKRIPETIRAYKLFQKGKKDVFLYLHMSGTDKMGWRFPDLFKQ